MIIQWGKKGITIQNQSKTPLCNAKDGAQEIPLNMLENMVGKGKITFEVETEEGNKDERELVGEENLSIKSRPHAHWGFAPC